MDNKFSLRDNGISRFALVSEADPDWLPEARKRKYNWDRKSQVLVKKLG